MIIQRKPKLFLPKQSSFLYQYDELLDDDSNMWTGIVLRDDTIFPHIKILRCRRKIIIFKKNNFDAPSSFQPSEKQAILGEKTTFSTKYCKKKITGILVRYDEDRPFCFVIHARNFFFTNMDSTINGGDVLSELII